MKSIFHTGFWIVFFILAGQGIISAQTPERLRFRNRSFDTPNKYFVIPPGWHPQVLFLGVKKIKELRLARFYREGEKSQKGNTHIALGTYTTGTRENVGQKLRYPIIPGHNYQMNIWLAWSPERTTVHPIQHLQAQEYDLRPVKLQVYGFHSKEDFSNRLLAETPAVNHADWKNYTLEWISPAQYQYIYLVASWEGNEYYNGNILLDNVSDISVSILPVRN